MAARGKLVDRLWKRADGPATIDDISVLVIPLLAYKQEYLEWKLCMNEKRKRKPLLEEGDSQNLEQEVTEALVEGVEDQVSENGSLDKSDDDEDAVK